MLRSFPRPASFPRRQLAFLVPVIALVFSACQGVKDKIDEKLYATAAPDDGGWKRDSTLIAKNPAVLYRVVRKKSDEFIFPIAVLSKGIPRNLRLSKRGWATFDIQTLYEGKEVTPVQNGRAGSPVKMRQGMWETASAPLDTFPPNVCRSPIPIGKVSLPAGTDIVVTNYKLPTEVRTLTEGEMMAAVHQVPTLVTPGLGITPSVLASYARTVRQIPRVGANPAVFVEYHDARPVTDTSSIEQRLPRHVLIILEKGVYTYRPSWIYTTTGKPNDRPILKYLESMDLDGDGNAEVLYGVDVGNNMSFTIAFRQYNDTWKEFWRRSPVRCDG